MRANPYFTSVFDIQRLLRISFERTSNVAHMWTGAGLAHHTMGSRVRRVAAEGQPLRNDGRTRTGLSLRVGSTEAELRA